MRSKTEATHSRNKGGHTKAWNGARDLDLEEEHEKRWVGVRSNERQQRLHEEEEEEEEEDGCEAKRRLHTLVRSPPSDGEEVGESDPPVHAVGEHTHQPPRWWAGGQCLPHPRDLLVGLPGLALLWPGRPTFQQCSVDAPRAGSLFTSVFC